jgi:hypothetical protein
MARSPRPRKRAAAIGGELERLAQCGCKHCEVNIMKLLTRYGEACARARLRTAAAEIRRALPMAQEDCADMLRDMARPKRRKAVG